MLLKRKTRKALSLLIGIILLASYLIYNLTNTPNEPQKVNSECSVHFIDVGQGDSILICNGDETALIDAGENNRGDDVLLYLSRLGIDNLDYVIGTHAHSDHIGGLDTVLNLKTLFFPTFLILWCQIQRHIQICLKQLLTTR